MKHYIEQLMEQPRKKCLFHNSWNNIYVKCNMYYALYLNQSISTAGSEVKHKIRIVSDFLLCAI